MGNETITQTIRMSAETASALEDLREQLVEAGVVQTKGDLLDWLVKLGNEAGEGENPLRDATPASRESINRVNSYLSAIADEVSRLAVDREQAIVAAKDEARAELTEVLTTAMQLAEAERDEALSEKVEAVRRMDQALRLLGVAQAREGELRQALADKDAKIEELESKLAEARRGDE